jgi:hypothetical protein
MRRSHSVSETSVGLFAFLDVLMSTMGSLILVLMIVSPRIRQEKVAKAATEAARDVVKIEPAPAARPAPVPKPLPVAVQPRETIDLNAKFATRVTELSAQAEEKRRAAADAARALAAERGRLKQVQANREELEGELAELRAAKDRTLTSVKDLSAQGIEVESELAKRGSRLRKIRDQIAHDSTEYAFLAYDGVSGTTRRPILIECADDQIKFPQENIVLTSADLAGFTTATNPLKAGAEALVDYWSAHSAPNDPKPYVLMVVRPSGTLAYYRARKLLERMRAPFGYELLPEDQKLAAPAPDAQAVTACRQAIAQAIAKRDSVFDQVFATDGSLDPRAPWRRGVGRSRGNLSGAGGSGTAGKPSPFDDPFELSSNGSKGTGKGPPGDSLLASGNATTGSAVPGGFGPVGAGSGGTGGGGLAAAGGGLGGVDGGGVRGGGVGEGNDGPNDATQKSGSGDTRDGPDQSGAAGKPSGAAGASPIGESVAVGDPSSSPAAQSTGGRGSESGIELLPVSDAGHSGVSDIGTANGAMTDPSALSQGQAPASQSQPGQPSDLGSFPTTPILRSGSGVFSQTAPGQGRAAGGSRQSELSAPGEGQPGSPQVAPQAGASGAAGESASSGGYPSGGSSSADPGGEPGSSSSSSAGEAGVAGLANFNQDRDDPPPRSGVKRRWGYSSPQASIGFERDVTVWVEARAIVVGGQPPFAISGAESGQRLAALVTAAVERDARTWGRPPDHLYWVPNIKFVVSPGGNLPFERLRPTMERQGLISSVEYRLELQSPRQSFHSWVE